MKNLGRMRRFGVKKGLLKKKMKIIVMGTGDFIVPSFERLLASEHEILMLVTMPIRTRRKESRLTPAVRRVAEENRIPLAEPENVNAPEEVERLKQLGADLIFICDYGKILSPEAIRTARLGGINLHGSLLPKYRGAAPVNRAILDGETTLGVSVIHITPEVDAGPVILAGSIETELSEEAPEIESRLAAIGAPLVLEGIRRIEAGTAEAIPQNPLDATRAPKIKKEEGRIDWRRSAREIVNQYRALQPWPKTFCDWPRTPNVEPLRLILEKISAEEESYSGDETPGTVLTAEKDKIIVRVGGGAIRIREIQPAGKRRMTAEEFLRGYRMKAGEKLQ